MRIGHSDVVINNRFYYFKHIVNIIQGSDYKNHKHAEADPKKHYAYRQKESTILTECIRTF